jgi:WD40 repeat protein
MGITLFLYNREQGPREEVVPASLTEEERELGVEAVLDLPLNIDPVWRRRSPSALAFSPYGDRIAGTDGYTVYVWDSDDGSRIDAQTFLLRGAPMPALVAYAKDGRLAAAAYGQSGDITLTLWNEAGERIATASAEGGRVSGLAFSPDDEHLAWLAGSTLGVWHPETERLTQVDHDGALDAIAYLRGDYGADTILAFSGFRVETRDPTSMEVTRAFEVTSTGTFPLCPVAGGGSMIYAGHGRVELRETASGRVVAEQSGFADNIVEACAPQDLSWVAFGTSGGAIELWRPADGIKIAAVQAHDLRVQALACSELGTLVSADAEVAKVWDVAQLERQWRP